MRLIRQSRQRESAVLKQAPKILCYTENALPASCTGPDGALLRYRCETLLKGVTENGIYPDMGMI